MNYWRLSEVSSLRKKENYPKHIRAQSCDICMHKLNKLFVKNWYFTNQPRALTIVDQLGIDTAFPWKRNHELGPN